LKALPISEHVIEPAKKTVDAPLKPVTLHMNELFKHVTAKIKETTGKA